MTGGNQYLLSVSGYQGAVGDGGLTVSWEAAAPPIDPYTCDTPGPDTFSQNATDVLTAGGVACAGGTTTENAYCRVYNAADMGNDVFTIDCIRFGITNPGSYIEGAVNVFKSANGTAVPYAALELLGSAPYGFYTTDGLVYDVASFADGVNVDLSDGSALVLEVALPQSLDGFVSVGGGPAAAPALDGGGAHPLHRLVRARRSLVYGLGVARRRGEFPRRGAGARRRRRV